MVDPNHLGVVWRRSRKANQEEAEIFPIAAAAERVREGAPIGRSLAESRLFPPMAVHLIGSGETSGELEDMLERAAANQERELDGMLQALVGLLGPMMIVVMGVFVLAIVFAMLMPIFEMNTLVR